MLKKTDDFLGRYARICPIARLLSPVFTAAFYVGLAAAALLLITALIVLFVSVEPEKMLLPPGMQALRDVLKQEGFRLVSGGSDNHVVLVDVKSSIGMSGKEAEKLLDEVSITCNKNSIPFDEEKPFTTSGIRLGSAAMTTRGLKENEFMQIGKWIASLLKDPSVPNKQRIKQEVLTLTAKYPIAPLL